MPLAQPIDLPHAPTPTRYRRALGPLRSKRLRRELTAEVDALIEIGTFDKRPRHGNGVSGDCRTGPCPWFSCRHNTFLEVDPITGAVKMNFPGKEIDEVGETCSLRSAERGGMQRRQVARELNLTTRRIHQVEAGALVKIRPFIR